MAFTYFCTRKIRYPLSFIPKTMALLIAEFLPLNAFASGPDLHTDPSASVIFGLTVIFVLGVIGRYLAMRFKQPGVLGEILMGIVAGNIAYFCGEQLVVVLREGSAVFSILRELFQGLSLSQAVQNTIPDSQNAAEVFSALNSTNGHEYFKIAYMVDIFSRFGVIFLLFMVGLESSVEELKHTGKEACFVAIIGVLAPMVLGYITAAIFIPTAAFSTNLFIGATLSATSIGITASVLKDMRILHLRESKTILGAAILDDILGLILLAVVSSLVIKGAFDGFVLIQIIFMSLLFFAGVLYIGPWIIRRAIALLQIFELWQAKLIIAFVLVMALACLANWVHLAAIIGAFAAGLLMHDAYFQKKKNTGQQISISTLVTPFEAIFAPIFFMFIGIQVKVESFFNLQVLALSLCLIIAAIVGKLIAGFGANRKDNRLFIGIGMLPRGEVGLVFASIGRTLGVIPDTLFSAIILMIIVTTLIVPLLLKRVYTKSNMVNKT